MEINFTSREMLVGEMLMGNRSVSFVVCYFGDLLKSANMASVRHKTFIRGSEWGGSKCRLSVKISLLCRLSAKIFDLCRLSVNLS